MGKEYKLSVAMCTFNGERYIADQLNSIVRQILPVHEIIICDDQSSDNTLNIIKDFALLNTNILFKIIRNDHKLGVTKNFEKAISLCSGDIIFLSDQDDIWNSDKTLRIIDAFNNNPQIGLVCSNANLIDCNGVKKTIHTLFDACGLRQLLPLWKNGFQFEIENVIQRLLGATFGIRREFAQLCLPFNLDIPNYHDGQIAMFAICENNCYIIDDCLIQYRIHKENVVGLGGNNNWVFNNKTAPNEFRILIEPRAINKFFLTEKAINIKDRVDFFSQRNRHYSSILGKFRLILFLPKYIKYYNKYFLPFFINDLLYGLPLFLYKKVIDKICSYYEKKICGSTIS